MADLAADHRCLVPTLPLGAHRHAMRASADLLLPGIARLAAEFLDLRDVTGGALVQLLMCDGDARIGRAVLASCDAFDIFPPGLTGKTLLAGKLPPPLFRAELCCPRPVNRCLSRCPGGRTERMFEGFALERINVGDAELRVRYGGAGPPVLLLHGHPRTHVT